MQLTKTKTSYLLTILFLLSFLIASCATQHKYKKYKSIPCPCEKENKR